MKAAAAEAAAQVQKRQGDLNEAQKKKEEQGKKVDDSVQAAKVDMHNQAKVRACRGWPPDCHRWPLMTID